MVGRILERVRRSRQAVQDPACTGGFAVRRIADHGGYGRRVVSAWLVALSCSAALGAQDPVATEDLDALSLEELLAVEVTTVTHQEIRVGDVPAALYVITRQDIVRSGLTTVPELLRLVPGLSVARIDAGRWSIGARGFAGEFVNRLLVLIDGRRVYSPLFGGVHWDVQDLNVEDVERIEVIRGPGGVRWGANAVQGVIHVITRTSAQTQGGLVQTVVGSEDRVIATARYGGHIDESTTWRAFARYLQRDAQVDADGRKADDGGDLSRVGLRFDGGLGDDQPWTFDAGIYRGISRSNAALVDPTPPFTVTRLVEQPVEGGHLFAEWRPRVVARHESRVAAWFDANSRDVPGLLAERRRTFAAEFSHGFPETSLGSFTVGGGIRHQRLALTTTSRSAADDHSQHLDVIDAFVEDRITFDAVTTYVGAKLEYNDFVGLQLQPNLRLAWQPSEDTTVWGAVSRAVRTPNFVDDDLRLAVFVEDDTGAPRPAQLQSNRALDAESMLAWELGFRSRLADGFHVDLAGFYYDYDDLVVYRPAEPLPTPQMPPGSLGLFIENGSTARLWGGELVAVWDADQDTRIQASYSYAFADVDVDAPGLIQSAASSGDSAPRHQAQLHLHRDLGDAWSVDLHTYWVDRVRAFDVDAYTRLDLRVGWQPDDRLRLDVVGQNLLDDRHPESPGQFIGRSTEVQRAVSFLVTHRF